MTDGYVVSVSEGMTIAAFRRELKRRDYAISDQLNHVEAINDRLEHFLDRIDTERRAIASAVARDHQTAIEDHRMMISMSLYDAGPVKASRDKEQSYLNGLLRNRKRWIARNLSRVKPGGAHRNVSMRFSLRNWFLWAEWRSGKTYRTIATENAMSYGRVYQIVALMRRMLNHPSRRTLLGPGAQA